ncbi:MAG: hypothetical protein AB8B61_07935 [Cyclobacteriaceae bacterium]
MTFFEYCTDKKIDAVLFKKNEPEQYNALENIFSQMHPASFTEQKKFLINPIRRNYQLRLTEAVAAKKPLVAAKPKIPGVAKPVVKKPPMGIKIPVPKKKS